MKILVTGGAGFIGSHLVDGLLEAGHDVVIVDDLSRGRSENLNSAARFERLDICDPQIESLFSAWQPEVVMHQAALANVRESFEDPLEYARVNVLGSLNLIEFSRRHSVRKFIYASTGGAVYGEPVHLPVTEDHPIRPLDPYGASKHHVEHYLELYQINFDLDFSILRYPNVYGPRQDPYGEAGVIAIFAQAMLEGRQPIINGDGLQERDFLYVGDVLRANLAALEKGPAGIYNLGHGQGVNVNQIFQILQQETGFTGEEEHGPAKLGEVQRTFLDASAAARDLGWSVSTSLASGCAKTVEWFRGSG